MAPSMLALSYVLVVFLSRMRPRVFTRANLCGMKGEVTGARILLSLLPSFPLIRAPALVIQIGLDKAILQLVATPGNRCRRIVALEKVAGSSPDGHSKESPSKTGTEITNREPQDSFRGSPDAIGDAM